MSDVCNIGSLIWFCKKICLVFPLFEFTRYYLSARRVEITEMRVIVRRALGDNNYGLECQDIIEIIVDSARGSG